MAFSLSGFSNTLSQVTGLAGQVGQIVSLFKGGGRSAPRAPAPAPAMTVAAPRSSFGSGPFGGAITRGVVAATTAAPVTPRSPGLVDDLLDKSDARFLARGLVPWGSDAHVALVQAGVRLRTVTRLVKTASDGGGDVYRRVKFVTNRARRTNYASPARVRDAAKTMRALKRRNKLNKEFASACRAIMPRPRTSKTTRRKR